MLIWILPVSSYLVHSLACEAGTDVEKSTDFITRFEEMVRSPDVSKNSISTINKWE